MSIWDKNRGSFIDSDIAPHFSNQRYMPYHHKIQRKINRFSQDSYFVINPSGKGSVFETGVEKSKHLIDSSLNIDVYKDGDLFS